MKFSHVIQEVEMRSADLAMTPLMLAERDREFLKQCRRFVWSKR
jgi:GRIM-19 protein